MGKHPRASTHKFLFSIIEAFDKYKRSPTLTQQNHTSNSPFRSQFLSSPLRGPEKMNRKAGDWNCRSCQHLNFSRRDLCQLCGDLRSGDYGSFGSVRTGSSFGLGGSDVRPGDWYCQCGVHNFASRSSCFKCGSFKDGSAGPGGFDGDVRKSRGLGLVSVAGGVWKTGDWMCNRVGCNEHNFASRMECFRCSAPRDSGTEV